VFRLSPSSAIAHSMLAFQPDKIEASYRQGAKDAEAFLRQPEAALAA
jgi:hypothetical protein